MGDEYINLVDNLILYPHLKFNDEKSIVSAHTFRLKLHRTCKCD